MKKECNVCWMAALGAFAIAFCGFAVMIRGWPEGDWGFGWGAIGAISTITIGLLAAHISHTQKTWIAEKREADKERITDDLHATAHDTFMTFAFLRSDLKQWRDRDLSALTYWASELERSKSALQAVLKRDAAYLLQQTQRNEFSSLSERLEAFCFLLKLALDDDTGKQEKLLKQLESASDSIVLELSRRLEDGGAAFRDFIKDVIELPTGTPAPASPPEPQNHP